MVAASKGPILEELTRLGFGAYNLAGNSKSKAALIIFSVAATSAGNPPEGLKLYDQVLNGESALSQRCIDLGSSYKRNKQ